LTNHRRQKNEKINNFAGHSVDEAFELSTCIGATKPYPTQKLRHQTTLFAILGIT
jgi:hypothetical protein